MPTAAVYRRFDEMGLGFDADIANEPNWDEWSSLPAKDLLVRLVNDLEAPAFELRPDLAALRAEAESKLQRPVRMSGSGSSLFTLFDEDAHEAESAAAGISARLGVNAVAVEMTPAVPDDLNATRPVA
jgi:4-diphosphocytidyl-2C-methyl-D-erythritol kinase